MVWQDGEVHDSAGSLLFFFFGLSLCLFFWPEVGDPFVSQNPREAFASYSPELILGCEYTTCPYSQIKNFQATPSGLPSSPSCVYSYTLLALINCIRSLYDGSFRFYQHKTHKLFCCVLSTFLKKCSWSLYLVLLFVAIKFLSLGFLRSISKSFGVIFHFFVAWNVYIIVFLSIFVF